MSKENATQVGRHLVMVGRLLDSDPELAYLHAHAAVTRAGRVDVVREAAGLAAYRTGRYAEALRELRTVRRLNGSSEHLAVMADCERGLGRPERAVSLAQEPEANTLTPAARLELAMVVSGARLDLDQPEAALAVLDTAEVRAAKGEEAARVAEARAAALTALGRADEAAAELARHGIVEHDDDAQDDFDDDIVVFDLEDDDDESDDESDDGAQDGSDDRGGDDFDEDGSDEDDDSIVGHSDGDSVDGGADAVEAQGRAEDAVGVDEAGDVDAGDEE
ncbi:hypothetical protein [Cellulomonas composti]|uniref:hypothetical protein n=1 Tax=Cellulomonas composti TaxID=266130 RepID=UPI001FE2DB9C|nr:hypothetical protein [Cellulomonas composti]